MFNGTINSYIVYNVSCIRLKVIGISIHISNTAPKYLHNTTDAIHITIEIISLDFKGLINSSTFLIKLDCISTAAFSRLLREVYFNGIVAVSSGVSYVKIFLFIS